MRFLRRICEAAGRKAVRLRRDDILKACGCVALCPVCNEPLNDKSHYEELDTEGLVKYKCACCKRPAIFHYGIAPGPIYMRSMTEGLYKEGVVMVKETEIQPLNLKAAEEDQALCGYEGIMHSSKKQHGPRHIPIEIKTKNQHRAMCVRLWHAGWKIPQPSSTIGGNRWSAKAYRSSCVMWLNHENKEITYTDSRELARQRYHILDIRPIDALDWLERNGGLMVFRPTGIEPDPALTLLKDMGYEDLTSHIANLGYNAYILYNTVGGKLMVKSMVEYTSVELDNPRPFVSGLEFIEHFDKTKKKEAVEDPYNTQILHGYRVPSERASLLAALKGLGDCGPSPAFCAQMQTPQSQAARMQAWRSYEQEQQYAKGIPHKPEVSPHAYAVRTGNISVGDHVRVVCDFPSMHMGWTGIWTPTMSSVAGQHSRHQHRINKVLAVDPDGGYQLEVCDVRPEVPDKIWFPAFSVVKFEPPEVVIPRFHGHKAEIVGSKIKVGCHFIAADAVLPLVRALSTLADNGYSDVSVKIGDESHKLGDYLAYLVSLQDIASKVVG